MNSKSFLFITDYRDKFESKFNDSPYRSGMDQNLIKKYINSYGHRVEFINISEIDKITAHDVNCPIILTSVEEPTSEYKSFIIDVAEYLNTSGYHLIPSIDLLKAHENKVYMELYLKHVYKGGIKSLETNVFGNIQDLKRAIQQKEIKYPVVVKGSKGSQGKTTRLAKNNNELLQQAKRISGQTSWLHYIKEWGRTIKHKGYSHEVISKDKFITQEFLPGLNNDWKILIFGERIFVLKRGIEKNGFKASGQGIDYSSGSRSGFPVKFLDTVYNLFQELHTPYASLDIAIKDNKVYLFEYQCVLFGKSTILMSDDFYERKNDQWVLSSDIPNQERLLVESIIYYNNKFL